MDERKCCDCGDTFTPSTEHQRRCKHCQVAKDFG
jgi:DNA-directed RNA polymerase subunit RPC12/RpoP